MMNSTALVLGGESVDLMILTFFRGLKLCWGPDTFFMIFGLVDSFVVGLIFVTIVLASTVGYSVFSEETSGSDPFSS
jgi:hypothetical protein